MTVSSTTTRNEYNGNAATTTFSYTFRILDQSHIAVYVDDVLLTITTDYTVTGVGDSGGGSIEFVSAPASGTGNVVFVRDVPLTQETDYVENDPFPAESHEEALDKLTMITQQLSNSYLSSLRVPVVEGDVGDLPAAATRASKYLAFDTDGLPVVAAGTTSDIVVTPFMETVLDDLNATEARATLSAQASSAILAAFAALVSAGNQFGMFSSANTFSLIDFKDQDDMASNSATALPSQQSVKAYVDGRTPLSSVFVSTEQTLTPGALLTIAHGFGGKPKLMNAWLVCKTAENGYSIGDEIFIVVGSDDTYSLGYGCVVIRDATNILVRFGNDASNLFFMPRKDTGARALLTNANWKIVFQAFF